MGNKLEFRDFGIFEVVKRRSRNGRNPRTGEKVFVPAKQVVSFKMGRQMKKVVAGDDDPAPGTDSDAEAAASDAVDAPRATIHQMPTAADAAPGVDTTAPLASGGSPDQTEGQTTP